MFLQLPITTLFKKTLQKNSRVCRIPSDPRLPSMESPSGIDLHCYEDMSLFVYDVSIDISKYHTILSYIPDSELQNYCKYLNISSANVAPRADLENEILGFRENEHTQLDCSRVQRLLDDAGMDTNGSMQTMLNCLVSAYTRNVQILSQVKMHVTNRVGEHSRLFPHIKYDGIRLDNRFDVPIVKRAPTCNRVSDENVNRNNASASGVQSLCNISSEKLEEILDFLNIDTSMLTTSSELQAKVRGLSCDDLDRVFDDCGIQHEFNREIKFFLLAEIAAKNDILQRKMEAHAANAPQCKDSELFKFLKYEGLNLVM